MYEIKGLITMRFKEHNWIKCFNEYNKKTTLRTHPIKTGHHNVYSGSYFKSKLIGELTITEIYKIKFKDLTEQHAVLDGFKTLNELKTELRNLNKNINDDTLLYQHWINKPILLNKRI
jgi:hypothetical protein